MLTILVLCSMFSWSVAMSHELPPYIWSRVTRPHTDCVLSAVSRLSAQLQTTLPHSPP